MTDTSSDPTYNSQAANRGLLLFLLPPASVVALVPAWAVLCGAFTALRGTWTAHSEASGIPNSDTWVTLVLVVFVVQILWSTGRALLIENNRTYGLIDRVLDPPPQSRTRHRTPRLPYTTPWSPLGRLERGWHMPSLPESARWTLVLVLLLTAILSAMIDWQMTLLSLTAAVLSLIEWRVARRGSTASALQAGTLIGLGWLAGHSVFAPPTWTSLILACCYAITYQGALELDRADPWHQETHSTENHRLSWALSLVFGGQGAAFALLVILGRPLAATLSGLLLAPQGLLLALLDTHTRQSYIRKAIPFVTAAMIIAAGAVTV